MRRASPLRLSDNAECRSVLKVSGINKLANVYGILYSANFHQFIY
jgi:hypothetical protein